MQFVAVSYYLWQRGQHDCVCVRVCSPHVTSTCRIVGGQGGVHAHLVGLMEEEGAKGGEGTG